MPDAHGTPAMYSHGRCRCVPCREAASAAARHRYRMIAYGKWQPFTDAAPAREHVRSLQAQGLGWQRIAELAGVAPPTVSSMLYGRAGRPPTVRIRTATAEALLAFRPALDDLPATAPVDATGPRRRLQALATAGWSANRLADLLGAERTHVARVVRGEKRRVTAATARAVRGLYDELWDRPPPEGDRWEKVAAARTRNHARRSGWVPAGAWDDGPGPHCIDDPAAKPVPGSWHRRDRAASSPGVFVEEATFLLGAGESPAQVAARLGVLEKTLERELGRHRARERRAAAGQQRGEAA